MLTAPWFARACAVPNLACCRPTPLPGLQVREAMARVEEVEAAQREKGVEQGPRIACSQ